MLEIGDRAGPQVGKHWNHQGTTKETSMETNQFDELTSSLATSGNRRGAVRALAAAAFGLGGLSLLRQEEADARRKHKKHKHNGGTVPPPSPPSPPPPPSVQFLQACSPGDVCVPPGDGITTTVVCGRKTTDHTCSDSFPGITNYCCVPQGSPCFNNSCQCCGDPDPNVETYCGNPDPVTGGTCTTRP
jgi:hypothetical protein